MQLHQLQPIHKNKVKKRIGRGGKRGTYSGRGQKGQKARAGAKIKPAERKLFLKLPKLRGVKNKPFKKKPVILNIDDLEKIIKNGQKINKEILLEKGMIKKLSQEVKILGKGRTKKSWEIKGIKTSKSAKIKIEQAGGRIIQ
ncbi:50S ribosomal protein L15 [Candidatus Jorgensenbacteria bacterium CG_4_8_14_3_um_filter_38_10]|nr:MAG: 50S ribosomal protein L15 [Candidatus Jorgensenbacteria bacterium CG_4_8_14_3_um_filter_38_10]